MKTFTARKFLNITTQNRNLLLTSFLTNLSNQFKLELPQVLNQMEADDLEVIRNSKEESKSHIYRSAKPSTEKRETEEDLNINNRHDPPTQFEDDLICHEDLEVGSRENYDYTKQDNSEKNLREEPLTEYEIRLFSLIKAMSTHLGKITSSINHQPSEKQ